MKNFNIKFKDEALANLFQKTFVMRFGETSRPRSCLNVWLTPPDLWPTGNSAFKRRSSNDT